MNKPLQGKSRWGVTFMDVLLSLLVLGIVLSMSISYVVEVQEAISSGAYSPRHLP